ncbi:hypothetical protein [Caballeronia sp.]|uniref:hypothetical protein n=1 Tax=Caballeronia sp. TaxID=1931223 RepID=UPI003C6F5031
MDDADIEPPLAGYDGAAPFTIATFCKWYHLSRPFYYELKKLGKGPQELRIGSKKIVITQRCAHAWEQARFAEQVNASNAGDAA